MDTAQIAAAVWAYGSRTLVTGTPAAPTDRAGRIAEAVWEYVTRTLTGGRGGYVRATVGGQSRVSAGASGQGRVTARANGGDAGG